MTKAARTDMGVVVMTFYPPDVRYIPLQIIPAVPTILLADRVSGPPRDDVPLPTQPPYTAFVGNLAFDLTEGELEEFFAGSKV